MRSSNFWQFLLIYTLFTKHQLFKTFHFELWHIYVPKSIYPSLIQELLLVNLEKWFSLDISNQTHMKFIPQSSSFCYVTSQLQFVRGMKSSLDFQPRKMVGKCFIISCINSEKFKLVKYFYNKNCFCNWKQFGWWFF